jgi:hypothetical protein
MALSTASFRGEKTTFDSPGARTVRAQTVLQHRSQAADDCPDNLTPRDIRNSMERWVANGPPRSPGRLAGESAELRYGQGFRLMCAHVEATTVTARGAQL